MRIAALGRSAASWGAWCLLWAGIASAQPRDGRCVDLPALDTAKVAALPKGALCRLDGAARTCMAGLTLAADVKGERDLCLSRDGRPVQRPRCAARFRKTYSQALYAWQTGVKEPEGTPTEVLVSPGDVVREEVLVQPEPIVRPGPDGCAFARTLRMTFSRARSGGGPPPDARDREALEQRP